jgi:hypothetical protein
MPDELLHDLCSLQARVLTLMDDPTIRPNQQAFLYNTCNKVMDMKQQLEQAMMALPTDPYEGTNLYQTLQGTLKANVKEYVTRTKSTMLIHFP